MEFYISAAILVGVAVIMMIPKIVAKHRRSKSATADPFFDTITEYRNDAA